MCVVHGIKTLDKLKAFLYPISLPPNQNAPSIFISAFLNAKRAHTIFKECIHKHVISKQKKLTKNSDLLDYM
jgi:hypothetical protein